MTKTTRCTGPALLKDRLVKYKVLSVEFSYPDSNFFVFFPDALPQKDGILAEYDSLFRGKEIWLYSAEHMAENEFQRSSILADIAGFYRAFGLETAGDRPDLLVSELEFMHYLIYKEINAADDKKKDICIDAQKKFFNEHLYPSAKKMAEKIISHTQSGFYHGAGEDLLEFLEDERSRL